MFKAALRIRDAESSGLVFTAALRIRDADSLAVLPVLELSQFFLSNTDESANMQHSNCDELSTMSAEAASLGDDSTRETNTFKMDSCHGQIEDDVNI